MRKIASERVVRRNYPILTTMCFGTGSCLVIVHSLKWPGWALNDELHLMDNTNNSFLGGPAIIPLQFFLVYCKIPILYRQFFWKHTLQLLSSSVFFCAFEYCSTLARQQNKLWIATSKLQSQVLKYDYQQSHVVGRLKKNKKCPINLIEADWVKWFWFDW